MKKILIVLLIIAIASAGLTCIHFYNKTDSSHELILYGNIEIRQTDISFLVSGQIQNLLKEEGDIVKKGELLAELNARDYESSYNKALSDVARTRAVRDDAISKYNRNSILIKSGAVSKQDIETLYNQKNIAEAEFNAACSNNDYAKYQLEYTKIYAPDDGIITVRVVEPGTNVQKGQTVYTLAKNTPVWVRAYVNESNLGNIKYGDEVTVYTDTVNPITGTLREYQGKIGYISPVAEFTPKTVETADARTNLVYRLRVYIDNNDEFLRQGMPVTIKIHLENSQNTAKTLQNH
jgi:HlyD family secretion protein